jgi:hypothetical protein
MNAMIPARDQDPAHFERHQLSQFTKGWFVGNFKPALLETSAVEVAVKQYRAGAHEASHHPKIATELTAVVSGRVRMSGREVGPGEIVKIAPGGSTDFTALTDAVTVVVKMPCVAGDKYPDSGPA